SGAEMIVRARRAAIEAGTSAGRGPSRFLGGDALLAEPVHAVVGERDRSVDGDAWLERGVAVLARPQGLVLRAADLARVPELHAVPHVVEANEALVQTLDEAIGDGHVSQVSVSGAAAAAAALAAMSPAMPRRPPRAIHARTASREPQAALGAYP